jgi:iron-sulfur cluster repair protein YtfE (RIC family)
VRAGWETFKRQLHLHHTAEDTIVWPALRQRLSGSDGAQSVLDAMEAEHQQIDPLLSAMDDAFARAEEGRRGDARAISDVTDALTASLTSHLGHEERDGLPLIGAALTAAEWRAVGFKIARSNGLSAAGEMFAWLAEGADPGQAAAVVGTLPPPARLAYRAIWRPRYRRTPRW